MKLKYLLLAPLFVTSTGYTQQIFQAEKDTTKIYVVASMHDIMKKPYTINPRTENAIKNADLVLLEHAEPIRKIPEFAYAQQQENYKSIPDVDRCVSKHFGPQAADKMKELETIRPWFATLFLGKIYKEKGATGFDSIDTTVMRLAKENKKNVASLESVEEMGTALNKLTHAEELEYLQGSARLCVDPPFLELFEKRRQELSDAVLTGTPEQVSTAQERLEFMFGSSGAMSKKMIEPRNETLYNNLVKIVQPNKTYVVAVGAAHLMGATGIVERLKQAGYTVK